MLPLERRLRRKPKGGGDARLARGRLRFRCARPELHRRHRGGSLCSGGLRGHGRRDVHDGPRHAPCPAIWLRSDRIDGGRRRDAPSRLPQLDRKDIPRTRRRDRRPGRRLHDRLRCRSRVHVQLHPHAPRRPIHLRCTLHVRTGHTRRNLLGTPPTQRNRHPPHPPPPRPAHHPPARECPGRPERAHPQRRPAHVAFLSP